MSEALSSEWQKNVYYSVGDRVAFKIGNSPGVAAFECVQSHCSSYGNQPVANGNEYWKHYPRGFPRLRSYNDHSKA
ncbi:hypothetical protein M378DRAFT_69796 [Amanita muscaria Koide BX008]|uniref:Uncharacterized protein n=1 Tax=Amanita muscaria (strain Koide BX008) TaxID=946122 RepID=A0A0C2XIN3_AMAMK|nr:hypothetical protein M378DRAFT_69796 [Amanita muscaria Koide BX008]